MPYLIELIKIYYDKDEFKFDRFANPMRFIVETLNNIAQNSSIEQCEKLIVSLIDCKEELIKNKDLDLYYIYYIINNINEIYFKLKSQPMLFPDIANKIRDREFYFG